MNSLYIFGVLLLAAVACHAQTEEDREFPIYQRSCEERKEHFRGTVRTDFNVAAYSGTWFEIMRYQQQDEPVADCMSSSYSWGFISRSFRIDRTGRDFFEDELFERTATALLAFPDESPRRGLLNVTYYADREADETNYYLIATDYFQYAVGWACEDIDEDVSREFAWVLSRTPTLPESHDERVRNLIDLHFDTALLRNTTQDEAYCLDRVMPGLIKV